VSTFTEMQKMLPLHLYILKSGCKTEIGDSIAEVFSWCRTLHRERAKRGVGREDATYHRSLKWSSRCCMEDRLS